MANKTKFLKQMISTLVVCIVTAVAFYACFNLAMGWFSSNKEVDAKGMSVSAECTTSLVISHNLDDLLNNKGGTQSVEESFDATLIAVKHRGGSGTDKNDLMYLTNPEDINPATGLPESGSEATFALAENDATNTYYHDFTSYVGSAGKDLGETGLNISLGNQSELGTLISTNNYLKSVSIDVYYAEYSSYQNNSTNIGTYLGTLTLDALTTSFTIPKVNVTGSTPVKITLRCYYDGSKADDGGNIYLTTKSVGTEQVSIAIHMEAVEAS